MGDAVKPADPQGTAAAGLLHAGENARLLPGAAGEADSHQTALVIGHADGGGVARVGVHHRAVPDGLGAHLHLGEAVHGDHPTGTAHRQGNTVVLDAVDRAGELLQGGAEVDVLRHALAGQGDADVLARLEAAAGGLHIVLIDDGVGGQGDAAGGAGQIAGEGQDHHAAVPLGDGGNGALDKVIVVVLAQVGDGAPLLHERQGAGEHGGHDGPGDLAFGAIGVVGVALDDAVDVEQINIGLGRLADGGGVAEGHGIGVQSLGHGTELHGPHQVDRQVLLLDGLGETPILHQTLELGVGEDAGLQADGELPVEPGLGPVQQAVYILLAVGGNPVGDPLFDGYGPGAEGQGLRRSQLVFRLEGAVLIALEHARVGHFLDVALGPVAGNVREGGRRSRKRRHGQRQGEGQQASEQSFGFHIAPPCSCRAQGNITILLLKL